jgi:predicted flap endonuclease-1-like 5' DNA nuclease
MLELNPLENPNAWWQLTIIFVVAATLGFILGNLSGKDSISRLQLQLRKLDADLRNYELKKSNIHQRARTKTNHVQQISHDIHQADDLKRIAGIGVQIENFLNRHDIYTFKHLAGADHLYLAQLFENAGEPLNRVETSTWTNQASLAVDGKWYDLKKWQEEMDESKGEIYK